MIGDLSDLPQDPTGPGDAAAALAKLRAAQSAPPQDAAAALAQLRAGSRSPAPQKPSGVVNFLNTADNAMTFGLGQKFDAVLSALSDKVRGRDSFGDSYTKNLAAQHHGIDDFQAQHPIASGVAAGLGSVVPALIAGPETEAASMAPTLSRGARVAGGVKVGAGVGAVNALGNSQNTSSVGDQFKTAALGAAEGAPIGGIAATLAETVPLANRIRTAKTPGAAAVELQDFNAAKNIENYGRAYAEGQQTPTTPAVQAALDHPTVQPFADKFRASARGQGASDAVVLANAYKGMSRNQTALQQRMAAKVGDYDYDAELKIADLKAAKQVVRDALSSQSTKPPLSLDVPAETQTVEPRITPGHGPLTGPPDSGAGANGGTLADYTSGSAPVPGARPRQGPSGPSFQVRADPGTIVPGVDIETPRMTIQTAPAETVPPSMPSFPQATYEKANMAQAEKMLGNGTDAANRLINASRSAGRNLTKTTPEAYLRDVSRMTPEDAQNALAGVLAEAKRNTGLTVDPKTGFGVGPSLRALRVSPFVKALDARVGTAPIQAPFLGGSIVGGTQSLQDLLRGLGIGP